MPYYYHHKRRWNNMMPIFWSLPLRWLRVQKNMKLKPYWGIKFMGGGKRSNTWSNGRVILMPIIARNQWRMWMHWILWKVIWMLISYEHRRQLITEWSNHTRNQCLSSNPTISSLLNKFQSPSPLTLSMAYNKQQKGCHLLLFYFVYQLCLQHDI